MKFDKYSTGNRFPGESLLSILSRDVRAIEVDRRIKEIDFLDEFPAKYNLKKVAVDNRKVVYEIESPIIDFKFKTAVISTGYYQNILILINELGEEIPAGSLRLCKKVDDFLKLYLCKCFEEDHNFHYYIKIQFADEKKADLLFDAIESCHHMAAKIMFL